jgi:predicted DNA-binding transcriptional regulator YafY
VPQLHTLHQAVWQTQKLQLTYRLPYHNIQLQHIAEPYGLVAKANIWHLVYYRNGFRVLCVTDLLAAQLVAEPFQRQPDFDLAAFWQDWCAQQEASRSLYPVTVRVAPHFVAELPRHFGSEIGQIDSDGDWVTATLHFASLEAARNRLLGYGRALEVLEPRALRASIQDYAAQIKALYNGD